MVTLGIILIHNGDHDRIATSQAAIDSFARAVDGVVTVVVGEESKQPPIVDAALSQKLLAWYLSVTGDHRWANYLAPPLSFSERRRRLRASLKYSRKQFKRMLRRGKRVSVARAVSAKNIRAWKRMLQQGWDFLLVLEDDVVLAENSNKEIDACVHALRSTDPDDFLFASLAKALTLQQIGAGGLVTEKTDTLTWFRKPVSNTAAAYVVSRGLAKEFVSLVSRYRFLAQNPADWILNHMFMRLQRRRQPVACFHTREGIFVNRSILGELPSHTQV